MRATSISHLFETLVAFDLYLCRRLRCACFKAVIPSPTCCQSQHLSELKSFDVCVCLAVRYVWRRQVRTNIVVALGDLAFRFPNALEPWNPKIYDRLRDDCPRVRANAIMVLTHLILNDMVKVSHAFVYLCVCVCVFSHGGRSLPSLQYLAWNGGLEANNKGCRACAPPRFFESTSHFIEIYMPDVDAKTNLVSRGTNAGEGTG